MVLLVVFHHTAITYGTSGGWYYHEVSGDTSLSTRLLTVLCAVDQAFFMGLLFLLAGYFTPGSLARHGAAGYVKERLLRLGVPILLFGLVLSPITIALGRTASGKPFWPELVALWSHGVFSPGPLWFAVALLIFTGVFMAWRGLMPLPATAPQPRPFPSRLLLLAGALVTGAGAFALRLIWPVGVTPILDLQLGYFASYIVLFTAGCVAARYRWLDAIPARQRRLWLIVAVIAIVTAAYNILSAPPPGATHAVASASSSAGGWSMAAVSYAFWEPLVAWGLILGLIHLFTRRFAKLGPIWKALARRSYAIYVIHPPILVGTALLWHFVFVPHLVKFAITGTVACLVCFLIAGLLLRIPGVARIL